VASDRELMSDARVERVDVRGYEVPVQVGGSGPPLLLLHGAGGAGLWTEAHRRLADAFTVYAPVHPGFGGTELPDWVEGPEDVAFHTVDLADALALRRPLIVGLSLGGYIATELAIFRPDLPAGLVLVDALGLRPDQPMPDLFIMEPLEAGSMLVADPANLAALLPPGVQLPDTDFVVRQFQDQAAAARLLWRRSYDPRLERWLHHVTTPVLVLWGAEDRLLPPSHAEKLAGLLPNARVRVIEGAGHLPSIEAPDAFVAAVRDFAATLRLGA
jgi:pimeloyl-ACP methyl ester carboxylesterase